MQQAASRAGVFATVIIGASMTVASGCSSQQATYRTDLANADTVDVCETRGTKTICSRHHATDYALHVERFREFEEMRQLEQSEEW